jgi:penicillin-binding protein 2
MSFHPNDVQRRSRLASGLIALAIVWLATAFFRAQVVQNEQYSLQSTKNRLRAIPLIAPRAVVYDRRGQVIAESVPGYSVSLLSPTPDSLRATLRRFATRIALSDEQIESAVRRMRREPNRPTVVLADATFDQVSVLEEQRTDFPGLIIQAAPKRYYPDGPAVSAFIGYTGEITESELNSPTYAGYQSGQQIGKAGIERQYEAELRGREGSRFVMVDARGRVVQTSGVQPDIPPTSPPPLQTNIDLDLQRFVAELFGDTLQGGLAAVRPQSFHRGHSEGLLGSPAQRRAQAALQQGAAGCVSAGVDVQARDGCHRAGARRRGV